jgi:crossover junction endodeoxyribonuclease RusA
MRKRDLFNASAAMKAAIDGVIDAGLLPDDDWKCLEGGRMTGGLDRENPRVIMTFDRIDCD